MREDVKTRVLAVGKYIIRTKATIRKTTIVFGVGRTTIYVDITKRLPEINYQIALEVKSILKFNKAERHIRGGNATKKKLKKLMRFLPVRGTGKASIYREIYILNKKKK